MVQVIVLGNCGSCTLRSIAIIFHGHWKWCWNQRLHLLCQSRHTCYESKSFLIVLKSRPLYWQRGSFSTFNEVLVTAIEFEQYFTYDFVTTILFLLRMRPLCSDSDDLPWSYSFESKGTLPSSCFFQGHLVSVGFAVRCHRPDLTLSPWRWRNTL